jgi:hypothetical protein
LGFGFYSGQLYQLDQLGQLNLFFIILVFINIPNNPESAIQKKENRKNDSDFFGKIIEPGTE